MGSSSYTFQRCITCGKPSKVTKLFIIGTALIVNFTCIRQHKNTWRSQKLINRYYNGNITFAASVLFSANTFQKIPKYFRLAKVAFISESSYYEIEKKFLFPVANEAWLWEQRNLLDKIKNKGERVLSGDGRCESLRHNAKYLTYSFLDQELKKIINFSVTRCTEAGNSNRMEKLCFIKALNELEENNLVISQITTDRHIQIKKYIREERLEISHQFDIWHVCKNIKQKLLAASKKKSCHILQLWSKSIQNHFWWVCVTCKGREILLKEKWISIMFHIQNIHVFHGHYMYTECGHKKLPEYPNKQWIDPTCEAFDALQRTVLDKNPLNDLKHLVCFSHTGELEIYHALYNKWVPKSLHFSFLGMVCRSQLAAIDFNLGANLELSGRENLSFSKITKTWSTKPIKVNKDKKKFARMIKRVVSIVESGESLPLPEIPILPKNIAPGDRPNKEEVSRNQ